MAKVLILTRAFEAGGVSTALINMMKSINLEEHNVSVKCIEAIGPLIKEVPKEIKVEEIQFKNNDKYRMFINQRRVKVTNLKKFYNKSCKKLCQFWSGRKKDKNYYYKHVLDRTIPENERYDIVLEFYGYGCFTTAYAAKMVCAKHKIMWLHDEKMEWLKDVEEYLDDFTSFFCVSDTVMKNFTEQFPQYASKTKVFFNIMDTEKIRKNASENIDDERFKGDFKILTVGRLAEQKGYDLAVEAAAILKKENVDYKWFAVGEGLERDSLEKLIQQHGLERQFILLGEKENPFPYIRMCDLYVQPSRHEGFGLSIMEARILKRIILATKTECICEQIQDGKNGFLAQINSQSLAEKIIFIMKNPDLCIQIQENLEQEKYSFTQEIEELNRMIREAGEE